MNILVGGFSTTNNGLRKCRMMCELAQVYSLVENKGINWIFIHNAKKVI